MLWFFEREGRRTTIEVLHLPTGDYELRIENPDGVERAFHERRRPRETTARAAGDVRS
jgi:hypothetical protein